MLLAVPQQRQLLERLRGAGDQPVALTELRGIGIDFPAMVVSELELNGYAIERVYDDGRLVGVRLVESEARHAESARRRRRLPWAQPITSSGASSSPSQYLTPDGVGSRGDDD